jgi:murein DD-endopeptidase MepM/ murein hydrolase activator NlpD
MKPPFNLVVVYGDGSRVLRLCIPRGIAYAVIGLQAIVGTAMVGLSGDYAVLKRESGRVAELRQRAADQGAFLESLRPRLAAMRADVAKWKALHDKMWKAFGPVAGLDQKEAGIGGAPLDAGSPSAGEKRLPAGDMDLVETGVAAEGRRLRELARAASRTGKIVSSLPLRWPLRGRVNSGYGRRRSPWSGRAEQHNGIDIGSSPGTPVTAPAAGTVVAASAHGGFGKHVTLDHGNGVRSLYGHLRQVTVSPGQRVEKGQVIGLVGSTGRSTGPHLHYELMVEGKPVDPQGFLRAEH